MQRGDLVGAEAGLGQHLVGVRADGRRRAHRRRACCGRSAAPGRAAPRRRRRRRPARACACGWRGASSMLSTGAKQASLPSSSAHQSSRVLPRRMRVISARISGHGLRSYWPLMKRASRPMRSRHLGKELRLQRADRHVLAVGRLVGVVEGRAAVEQVVAALVAPAAAGRHAVEDRRQRGGAVDHRRIHHLAAAGAACARAARPAGPSPGTARRRRSRPPGSAAAPACRRPGRWHAARRSARCSSGRARRPAPAGRSGRSRSCGRRPGRGLRAWQSAGPRPRRSATPGRKPSISTSAPVDQPQHRVAPGRRLQVQRHRAPVAAVDVVALVHRHAQAAGFGAVDAHHVGAHVGQQHRAERAGADAGQFDDAQSFQRSHLVWCLQLMQGLSLPDARCTALSPARRASHRCPVIGAMHYSGVAALPAPSTPDDTHPGPAARPAQRRTCLGAGGARLRARADIRIPNLRRQDNMVQMSRDAWAEVADVPAGTPLAAGRLFDGRLRGAADAGRCAAARGGAGAGRHLVPARGRPRTRRRARPPSRRCSATSDAETLAILRRGVHADNLRTCMLMRTAAHHARRRRRRGVRQLRAIIGRADHRALLARLDDADAGAVRPHRPGHAAGAVAEAAALIPGATAARSSKAPATGRRWSSPTSVAAAHWAAGSTG